MQIHFRIPLCLCLLFCTGAKAESYTLTPYIMVDQFGYRPEDIKVAVIADPQAGSNAADTYVPGTVIEVRDLETDAVVFTGNAAVWNNGRIHAQSGDRGWWFDFTDLSTEGSYYIYDPENQAGSYAFVIDDYVYADVLKAALKMYFYNRCGGAKEMPFADACWTDGPSFDRPGQDTEARYVEDKTNDALIRDVSGGWFDAGDFNKYVTFTEDVLHQLLDAYTHNPDAWTDDFNIPESGNGLPDILDEIIWELDWLKKMQDMEDGGVFIKAGSVTYNTGSPPSTDKATRYYGPKCSSSTLTVASVFAHAAVVFSEFPQLENDADDLIQRALLAWQWAEENPVRENCDSQEIKSGDADRSQNDQESMAVTAAVYLFAATQDAVFDAYITDHYQEVDALNWWGPYGMASGDALLYYASRLNGDPAVQNDILNRKTGQAGWDQEFYRFYADKDLYRAHVPDAQYHWGSNCVKANTGNLNYDMITYELDPANEDLYLERAASMLHYLHGVNPGNKVYLSNMYDPGADDCVNEMYHGWFVSGGKWDNALTSECGPAPGFVVGGPNKDYSGSEPGIKDQPVQKAYKDGNSYSNAWEITEPSIYYQSAYLKLLSRFVSGHPATRINKQETAGLRPVTAGLQQNVPNPFNPETDIRYQLSAEGVVRLSVADVTGQTMEVLVDRTQPAGSYRTVWNASRFSSGIYLIVLQTANNRHVRKMIFLK